MKTIIAGSRTFHNPEILEIALKHVSWEITEVVSGRAKGIDKLGEQWARKHNIPVKFFPAKWERGLSAGYHRNLEMAEYADALLAIWDGKSKGTGHMIDIAKFKGLQTEVVILRPEEVTHGNV